METKPTHTPGPWVVGTKGAGMSIERNPTGEYPVAQWVYNPADAALIAAAPDLLAALKAVLKFQEDQYGPCLEKDPVYCEFCRARIAIAKAEAK